MGKILRNRTTITLNGHIMSKNNEAWLNRWQQNNIGFHLDEVNSTLIHYWSTLNTQPGDSVFVPLCGKSLDMIWLQKQGLHVTGAELSAIATKAFFTENRIPVTETPAASHTLWETEGIRILQGDFFALDAGSLSAETIFDRAALIALPPELQSRYVEQLLRIAPNIKSILLSTVSYDTNLMNGPPYSTPDSIVRTLYQPYFNVDLIATTTQSVSERFRQRGLEFMTDYVFKLERQGF